MFDHGLLGGSFDSSPYTRHKIFDPLSLKQNQFSIYAQNIKEKEKAQQYKPPMYENPRLKFSVPIEKLRKSPKKMKLRKLEPRY